MTIPHRWCDPFWPAWCWRRFRRPACGPRRTPTVSACHSDRALTAERNGKTVSVFVDEKTVSAASVHGTLPCVGCHADLAGKELPHEDARCARVECGACHADEQQQHSRSLHGKAIARGDPLAPRCTTCHGSHEMLA